MSEITNPQDAELEEVVLGACLLESKAITLVAGILRPEVFYTETNREIYAALQSMYHAGQVIDIMTIKEKFARRGKLEFIGGYYTNGITDIASLSPNKLLNKLLGCQYWNSTHDALSIKYLRQSVTLNKNRKLKS